MLDASTTFTTGAVRLRGEADEDEPEEVRVVEVGPLMMS